MFSPKTLERTIHLKGQGGAWEFRSHKGCKREGSSDGVRAAVRTGFALTPTPPASPAGLSNPEFHGPRGAEPPCRLHRVKAMALSRGTQAACRSSNEHVEGPQAGRQGLCSQPLQISCVATAKLLSLPSQSLARFLSPEKPKLFLWSHRKGTPARNRPLQSMPLTP